MGASQRQDYEQVCLRLVRKEALGNETFRRDGTEIHEIRLEGQPPETKLVVDLERLGQRDELEWRLWGNDFGMVPAGASPPSPEHVAQLVLVQLYEY